MKTAIGILVFIAGMSLAQADGGYACVGGYLYQPNSSKDYVGSSACASARIGSGYACVDGYLYLPNSSKEYVGSSTCKEANLGQQ